MNTDAQIELPIATQEREVTAEDKEILRAALDSARQQWLFANAVCRRIWEQSGETWSTVKVNLVGAAMEGRVISGAKGYKLIDHATPEEIEHFLNRETSRARHIEKRVIETRQMAHKIFG